MKPLIWLMNGSARMIIRMFGVDPDANNDAMSEEEIKIIINNSYNGGEINQTELAYMQNIFHLMKDMPRISWYRVHKWLH